MWWRPWFDELDQLLAQPGGGGDVDLAGDGEDRPAVPFRHLETEVDHTRPSRTGQRGPQTVQASRAGADVTAPVHRADRDHPMDVVTSSELRSWHPWRSPRPLSTRCLGALDDVGDPGIVHVERLAAAAGPHRRAGPPAARRGAATRSAWTDLWSHQAAAIDLARAGPFGGGRHRHGVGQVALLPGADRRGGRRPGAAGHGAAALPDQGAGPGPAAGAHRRSGCRRLVAGAYDGDCTPEAPGPRPQARVGAAHQPRDAPLRPPPPPRALGDVPHAAALRRGRRAAHAAGHLRHHVAHVLRRLRRLCARYGVVADVRLRARPPSASRPAWPRRCAASRSRRSSDDGSPRGERLVALWNPPLLDAATGARASSRRDHGPHGRRRSSARDHRAIAFCRSRRGTELVAADARRLPPRRPRAARSGPTGAATSPPSGARSRPSCSPAGCGAWSPPPPSSSASTSAASTPACSTASPAPSPRCGSRPAGPGASSSGRSPCSSPATTSSTSGSWPPRRAVHPAARAGGGQPVQPLRARRPPRLRRLRAAAHPRRRAVVGPRRPRRRRAPPRPRDRLEVRRVRRGQRRPQPRRCGRTAGSRPTASGCAAASSRELRIALADGTPGRHRRRAPGARGRAPRRGLPAPGPVLPGRARSTSTTAVAVVEPAAGDESTQARTATDHRACSTTSAPRRSAGPTCTSAPSR